MAPMHGNTAEQNEIDRIRSMFRLWRVVCLLIFCGHIAVAGMWCWAMPGGFPLGHLRFLANRVIPAVLIALCMIGLVALRYMKQALAGTLILTLGIAWAVVGISWRIVFFISAWPIWLVGVVGGLVLVTVSIPAYIKEPFPKHLLPVLIPLAVVLGVLTPLTQKADRADTRPLNQEFPKLEIPKSAGPVAPAPPRDTVVTHVKEGRVTVRSGGLTLDIRPFLTFRDRSPDGCWTVLAPDAGRYPPSRHVASSATAGRATEVLYFGNQRSLLQVYPQQPVIVQTYSELKQAFYSHLNSFCELRVTGHKRLSVAFAPCPNERIEVTPAGYPTGRPARMAYFTSEGAFHVVEGRSAEKGPFRELASGPFRRSELLTMKLFDEDRLACTLVFHDWASQAGTALSPTAGWGLPVNAVEFRLLGEAPDSPAALWLTLAGTSIGRGWDSVGHTAGIYRNRITIKTAK